MKSADLNHASIWRATIDLIRLLQSECNSEKTYQTWLEAHPAVFESLGFDRYASFEKSSGNRLPYDPERSYVPEPDFLCANATTGVLTVFELKTPFVGDPTTSRADGNREKFMATVESYISQVTEYCQSIQGRLEARDMIKKVLDISTISKYEIYLVYGFRSEWDQPSVEALVAQRNVPIKFIGFDQIYNQLLDKLASGKPAEPMLGWTYIYHISIPKTEGRRYIADMGNTRKDRVSFVREGEFIAFECLDSRGILHRLEARCDGGIHYIRFEFSHGGDMLFMCLHIDDEEHELRKRKIPLNCDPDPGRFILGSSLEQNKHAEFRLYGVTSIKRTMCIEERLKTHAEFLNMMKCRMYFEVQG